MLTSTNSTACGNIPLSITAGDTHKHLDHLLEKEWLLTNSRGGFASGTVLGCNTRRYHGLLTGTINPPANRILGLSNCFDVAKIDGVEIELSALEFHGGTVSESYKYITEFSMDVGAHFTYKFAGSILIKSIYLLPDADMVAVVYDFPKVSSRIDFSVRPFAAMRDFHSLQNSDAILACQWHGEGLLVSSSDENCGQLFLCSNDMWFEDSEQWWYNFLYRKELQRRQDCAEDLWSPGVFNRQVDSPCRIVLWASLNRYNETAETTDVDVDTVVDSLVLREKELTQGTTSNDERLKILHSAAGQFIVERRRQKQGTTILAGYPWFLDWGRDTFIALSGLLLCTKRFDEAAGVLTTFGEAISEGMIPNRFDDYANEAHYNSIDASLWFVHAAFEYLQASDDRDNFTENILPAVREIMDRYHHGTRFGIHADIDGLITGGDPDTQLTWMDAKHDGKAFTPRYGKAVEINALWYSGLCSLAEFYRDTDIEAAERYGEMAQLAGRSFCEKFWNESKGHLNDCIFPEGRKDASLRPNQIYAVSLPHSPLSTGQQKCVVGEVQRHLLTPYGLRTLNRDNKLYEGRYEGDQMQRDRAYHQGTVWVHLIGAFIEAYLKVNNFSRHSRKQAKGFLEPLLIHLTEDGCIGSISEIFDGDPPRKPRGCFAQAWAVAEVLRAYTLIRKQ